MDDRDFVYDSQPTLECIVEEVEIQNLSSLDDFDHQMAPHVVSRVSGESTNICGI